MSEQTYSSEGAECPKCKKIACDDDNWISRHGEDDVSFNCEGCGTPLIVYASFSIDFTTRVREDCR